MNEESNNNDVNKTGNAASDDKSTNSAKDATPKPGGMNKWVLVTLIVLGALVVGGVGYMMGATDGEENAAAQYQQQLDDTEQDIDTAKDAAGNELDKNQDDIEELQAENAELKQTIEDQEDKIADLEEQLEEAESSEETQSQE